MRYQTANAQFGEGNYSSSEFQIDIGFCRRCVEGFLSTKAIFSLFVAVFIVVSGNVKESKVAQLLASPLPPKSFHTVSLSCSNVSVRPSSSPSSFLCCWCTLSLSLPPLLAGDGSPPLPPTIAENHRKHVGISPYPSRGPQTAVQEKRQKNIS